MMAELLDDNKQLTASVREVHGLCDEHGDISTASLLAFQPGFVDRDAPPPLPGDGVHLLWQQVIGTVRGRNFILTRQELDAQTAKEWGVCVRRSKSERLRRERHE
jgi:hypothetical protein